MLSDFTGAAHIYIACGYTDLRRGIDGLAGIVQKKFALDPFADSLFLFCGRRRDRMKALYSCCISALNRAVSSGRETRRKRES